MIQISDTAYEFLLRKSKLYFSQNRFPRLIQTLKSCSGSRFAMCYDRQFEQDQIIRVKDLQILVDPALINEYGGFEMDTEQYFFAPRLLIKPYRNQFQCDCDTKCNKEVSL